MNTGSFVKGMVTGAVLGMGISVVVNPIDERDRRRITKKTTKMFTTIGSIADNMIDALK